LESASWTQELLNWVNTNPGWGAFIVFLVAFFESLVLIGILLPGIMILFGIGTLIGLGVIDILPVWIAASSGAFLGDTLSFALGYRYRQHLLEIWPFSRYPGMMERGLRFFNAHGAKSVVAGRFIGPLRPIIPAVVGIMHMKPSRFVVTDLAACVAWAPAFLVPGLLFGASLEVASEYTGRLTMVLVIGLFSLWLIWWLLRAAYEPLASRSARWMRHGIRWTRRHPVLGRVAAPLLDPARPEVLSISTSGLLLVVIFWGLVMLLFLSPFSSQPQALDQSVQDLALSLRNQLADPFFVAVSQVSRWQVTLLSSAAVFFWLLGAGRISAALHWLVAIGGGWLIQLLLAWGLRATPQVMEVNSELLRSPSSAMSLTTVVFCFFAVLIAGEVRRKHRQWPYLAAALILTLLLLARLYLGLEWLSGALMGVLLGLAWTLVIGIAYRQRAILSFSGALAGLIFYGSASLLFLWQVQANTATELQAIHTVASYPKMDEAMWWEEYWADLPGERTPSLAPDLRRFNAQVGAPVTTVAQALEQAGWMREGDSDWRWIIQALNPKPDRETLPLLGRAYLGRTEDLLMRKQLPDGRLVTFRLWDSGVRLQPGETPLYLAQLAEEQLVQRLGAFSYWRAQPLEAPEVDQLTEVLKSFEQRRASSGVRLLRER
jgi:membrane protein DedA with SNARE-associated domain